MTDKSIKDDQEKDQESVYDQSSIDSNVTDNEVLAIGVADEESQIDKNRGEDIIFPVPSVAEEAVSRKISKIQSNRESIKSGVVEPKITLKRTLTHDTKNYGRFTERKKRFIVCLAAASCFLSPMSTLAYLPAVPEISTEFNTTGEVINISAAVFCVFMSLSPCVFSPCSDIYGRKSTFVICLSMYTLCSTLVAVSQNLAMFYIFRAFSALFGTAFFTTAAHLVGDIYPPTERGTAMGWTLCGTQVGSALGPVIGGIIVTYTSWRVIFGVLAGLGFLFAVIVLFFLPETLEVTKLQLVLAEIRKDKPKKKFVWIPYNPFRVVEALKYPNLFLGGFIVMSLTFTMYGLLTPIRYVVDPRFNLTSPIYGALFYLPPGLGYLVGSILGGKWADIVVKYFIKKRGKRIPEDRIYATIIPLGVVYPVCMLVYGWSLEKKVGGMVLPIVFMFISGLAQTFVFPASNTYCVDSMPELGGDAVGSSYFSRYISSAVASATCLRSIQSIGIGWTCTISAFVLWVATGCAFILIWKGESLRIAALTKNGFKPKVRC
ncbi:dityrosine transporter 1 [[Candida] anglica]|uniref:Dityrosine transporter 1 n=1 Tax=[Candida] anglica TaxID=148631 RepID=A0ABP0EC03_9ASCO